MKKLLSAALSFLLVFGLALPALAAEADGAPGMMAFSPVPPAGSQGVPAQGEWVGAPTWIAGEEIPLSVEVPEVDEEEFSTLLVEMQKEALGLVYDVNVMVDGVVLAFPADTVPEIADGSTMIPLETLAEALGAEQTYDAATGEVKLTSGYTRVEFSIGGGNVFFHTDQPDGSGSGGNFFLDGGFPYLKDGAVYVPLRAVAEALGYDVEWSNTFRTAVLVDKAGFAAELDKKFTVLNAVLSMGSDLDLTQTYGGESALDVSVTLLDSINGDQTYTGSVTATALQNDILAYAAVQYNWDELMGLLVYLTGAAEEDTREILDVLDDGIETIIDMQAGRLYLRGQVLSAAFGAGAAGGETWFSMDLDTVYGDALDFAELAQRQSITVGEFAEMMNALLALDDPVYAYAALSGMAEALDFLSDSHFTREGNVWHYALELPALGENTASGGEIALDVTIEDGKATGLTGSVSYEAADLFAPGADGKLVCSLAFSALQATLSGTVDVKNTVHVEFSLTAENVPVQDAEFPEIPADAVDLGTLWTANMPDTDAGAIVVIHGADGPTAIYTTAVEPEFVYYEF